MELAVQVFSRPHDSHAVVPAPPPGEMLDAREALGRVDGDAELLQELVEVFLSDLGSLESEIEAAVASGDANRIARVAHRMKGSVATFAARSATAAAQRLEQIGRAAALDEVPEAIAVVRAELAQLPAALRALVAYARAKAA